MWIRIRQNAVSESSQGQDSNPELATYVEAETQTTRQNDGGESPPWAKRRTRDGGLEAETLTPKPPPHLPGQSFQVRGWSLRRPASGRGSPSGSLLESSSTAPCTNISM